MATTPHVPLRVAQTSSPTSTPPTHPTTLLKFALRMRAWNEGGELDKDDVLLLSEYGIDKIYRLRDTIERVGKEYAAPFFEWFKQLPPKERADILGEMFNGISKESQPTRSRSSPTPAKRSFMEVATPPNDASASSTHASASHNKRRKPISMSNMSSGRVQRYCPKCKSKRTNKFWSHIREHLDELCPSLSTSSGILLIGCGYCRADRRNKYYGKAFFGPDELVDHIVAVHSQHPTEHGWDITHAISNILTHEIFAGSYDELRRNKNVLTSSTSLDWTSSREANIVLDDLQELGGRLVHLNKMRIVPDRSDEATIAELLETVYAVAEVSDHRMQDTPAMSSASDLSFHTLSHPSSTGQRDASAEPLNSWLRGIDEYGLDVNFSFDDQEWTTPDLRLGSPSGI